VGLELRQRWQRQVLRACLPAFAGRDALLIDARSSTCRVALRAGGARRWLQIEFVENRRSILASVKVALQADEVLATYVSHGTPGEPLVQEVLATIDVSRHLLWEGGLDEERLGAVLGESIDDFWSEWCGEHSTHGRATEAIALGRRHHGVFVDARRQGGILPARLTTTEFLELSAVHPFIALGAEATVLGASATEALALSAIEAHIRSAVPGEPWADAVALAHVVGDG
jgi:hypothetical protein